MSIQSFIISHPKLAKLFMSTRSANFWQKQGEKTALKVFKNASRNSKAYRNFLKKHKINPEEVSTIGDFEKLPIINKKNYIQKYPLDSLVAGDLGAKYTVEKSSGHSGGSFFWPRTPEEDAIFPNYIEYSFIQFYNVNKIKTLVILTLALGTWTSGEKMAEALRMAAKNPRNKMTVITPGANLEEVLEIAQELSPNYKQIVIVGYPPFVKSVIDEGIKRKINWKKLNTKLGLGGEGYSEQWREHMAEKIGLNKKDLLGISGGYGAADVGMSVGREYPLSVLIRKIAYKDKKIAQEIFGVNTYLPSLLQYSSSSMYIEVNKEDELIFTANAGVPIVRYNIHDKGGVVKFDVMIGILRRHGYDVYKMLQDYGYEKGDIWTMPFFYVFGRSDGTISIDGANIYPENIEAVFYGNKETLLVHAYKLGLEVDEEMNSRPVIYIELNPEIKELSESEQVKLEQKLHDISLAKLLEVNADFKKSHLDNPKNADPIVRIYLFGEGPFSEDKKFIKRRYIFTKK
jgi:phenylacetate-CoA ligase